MDPAPSPPSYAALKRRRVRVISTPTLLGVTGLVLATLVMVFPRETLIAELKLPRPPRDERPAATNGSPALNGIPDPKDHAQRIIVSDRQFGLNELPEARTTIAPLKRAADPVKRREGLELDHQVLRIMINNSTTGSESQQAAIAELKRLLPELAKERFAQSSQLVFARESVVLGLPEVALEHYQHVVASGPVTADVLEEAVRHALSLGRYEEAAELYFTESDRAATLEERARLFRKGIETLLAGNLHAKALAAADRHLGPLERDEATLRFLAAVALAADTPGHQHAVRYFRALVRLSGGQAEVLEEAAAQIARLGRYQEAAALYFEARRRTGPLPERRQLFRRGIEQILAGALHAEALAAAERELGDLATDPQTLLFLARMARSTDTLGAAAALRYYRALLEGSPVRDEYLAEAVGHALGMGRHAEAAEFYFSARARVDGLEERRRYFRLGVETMLASGSNAATFAAVERHLRELGDDEETLRFLVRIALKANDQARAQSYARRLMRFSTMRAQPGLLARLGDFLIAPAHAQPALTLRPYNEESYRLAYDVFVANSNFGDARRVAQAAVAQRPEDLAWRIRLARVLEWAGEVAEALVHWRFVARRSGDGDAIQAMLRLGPGLGDDEATLEAWRLVARSRALTPAELRDLIDLYERTGRIDEGLAFFREQAARTNRPEALEMVALLADRADRIDEAIAVYEELARRNALGVEQATRLASLYFTRGEPRRAMEALDRVRDRVSPTEYEYWRQLGELAWQLGDDARASLAYETLARGDRIEGYERARLLRLIGKTRPAAAARMAEDQWLKLRDPELFILAAELYAGQQDWRALVRLFGTLTAEDERGFASNSYFFTLRARLNVARGRPAEAVADWRRALAIRSDDADLRAGLIWLLIETRRLDDLRRTLHVNLPEATREPAYWTAYAAGFQTLGEPQRALPFFRLALPSRRDDLLWLLAYADLLQDLGQGGMAWRIRRHAWQSLRDKHRGRGEAAPPPDELLATARLASQFAPGDPDLAVLRRLLSQGAGAGPNSTLDAAARDLVLSWAITNEQHPNAKAWLWERYARSLARPVWAEIAIALREHDLETMERLLAGNPLALPRYDRVDAARTLDRRHLAQTLGWHAQERYPYDDEVHVRLEQDVRATATGVSARLTFSQLGFLRQREEGLALHYWASERVRLMPHLTVRHPRSTNRAELVGVPAIDRTAGLAAEYRTRETSTLLDLARRSALADFTVARLEHRRQYGTRLSGSLEIGRNLYAPETAPTRVAGAKDEARIGLEYLLSKREYVNLGVASARYVTQERTFVGRGLRIEGEAGYRIRTEYPNLTARLNASHTRFDRAETTDALAAAINPGGAIPPGSFFLPPSFTVYAASIGFGEYLRDEYTRALRPFGSVGYAYNTVTGSGYNVGLGVGGSVFGPDHFSLAWIRSRGGDGLGLSSQEIGLRYQLWF